MSLDKWADLNTFQVFSVLFLLWLAKAVLVDSRRFLNDHYPPGPYAVPLFGNLFQLSMEIWVPLTEWKRKYGKYNYVKSGFHRLNQAPQDQSCT